MEKERNKGEGELGFVKEAIEEFSKKVVVEFPDEADKAATVEFTGQD